MLNRAAQSIFEIFQGLRKGSELGEEVFSRLKEPIPLRKGPITLFARVDDVKEVSTPLGKELQLQFRVGSVAPPPKPKEAPRTIISVPTDGRPRNEPPTLFYTFTSQNSMEENERNLSDFVFSQWEHVAANR